jgi:hypothetical protein
MSNGYFLADTNSLVYAYHAGGSRLLDTYLDAAEEQDRRFAITETVRQEIKKGPLGEDLLRYLAEREVPVLSSPETEQRLRAGTLSTKSAGEVSMLEVAQRESEAGRVTRIWSDDKYFDSEQIMRGHPDVHRTMSKELLDEIYEQNFITAADHQRFSASYDAQQVFQDSPRLRASRYDFASPDIDTPHRAYARGVVGGVALEAAVTVYEWNDTHQRAQVFRNTLNNETAAQDAYVRQGAQTAGAAVGTLAGGVTASALGLGSGGTLLLVAGGGYLVATGAEYAVEKWQQEKIYSQTDRDGVDWQFNGRQWLREDLRADLVDDGRDATQRQPFSALPDKARELSAMASAEAVKQALADAPEPRNPFVLPADDSDRHSLRTRNWNYEPETGKWLREVVTDLDHREMPSKFATIEADPARAAQLSAQAMAIIDSNLKAGPASIAAQYEIGHRARGYEQTVEGAIPPAVTTALDPDLLQASDGKHYRRDAQGAWTHADQAASPTRALELELTRERLLPALEQHRTQLADMPTWQPPTPQQQDRANLRQAYLDSGLNPDIRLERFEATYAALQRTRAEHGIGPENTSLTLDRDASGKFSMDSPIQHLRYDANGVVRIAATTTPEQIAVAAREAHAPTPAQDTAAPAAREAETLRQPERSAPAQDALPASPAQATDIRDERHLGHTRYLQAVDAIERSPNIPPAAFQDERLQQAAANLAWTSLAGGERAQGGQNERLERIDFAVLNTQRDGLIAGQGELGNPTAKLAFLPAAQDNATTLTQSSQQVHDSARQQREQVQMLAQQAPAPTLDDPGSKGPRLA